MRNWRSLFEILKYPLEIIFAAVIMIGAGNLITNQTYGTALIYNNDYLFAAAEIMIRTGQFIIVHFPFLFLIRLSARRGGSATTLISALCGYIGFLCATMLFASSSLPSSAFSSIFGLSVNKSMVSFVTPGVHYPLQTGMIGAVITALVTMWAYNRSRRRNEYGFFSFISRETSVMIRTTVFCILAGVLCAYGWPLLISGIQKVIHFISVDTTNPVNMALYGMSERVLGDFNLGTLIRQPFWYGTSGGSWINVAGGAVAGDVSIWTAQVNANAVAGMTGRFFTPYYIINIFAVPGMIWGMYSVTTDKMEKTKKRTLCIIATLVSLLAGILLPLELMLLLLCPLLFILHLGLTGLLYAAMQYFHVYLGYYSSEQLVMTAMPGTLPELISYLRYPSLSRTVIIIAGTGIVCMLIYFLLTRFYFRHLAVDLFRTGETDRMVKTTLGAVGGVENIRMVHSSITALTISVYDPTVMDLSLLKRLGSHRVYETRAGYSICFGA
nr:PTS transporter subunit EIIC [Solobacterium sp.]